MLYASSLLIIMHRYNCTVQKSSLYFASKQPNVPESFKVVLSNSFPGYWKAFLGFACFFTAAPIPNYFERIFFVCLFVFVKLLNTDL